MSLKSESGVLSENELHSLLVNFPLGFKIPSDEFFKNGNNLPPKFVKQGVISLLEADEESHAQTSITCNVFGCKQTFSTVLAYETHYKSLHFYICSLCKKNLPTAHLLDLHISEKHDSFFCVQSEKQPMFACYLEDCKYKSATSEERRDHCIRVHKIPSNFRFDNFSSFSKKVRSRKDGGHEDCMECDFDMNENKTNSSAIKNANFSFGQSKLKTFSERTTKSYARALTKNNGKTRFEMETNALEASQTVIDLISSLPNAE